MSTDHAHAPGDTHASPEPKSLSKKCPCGKPAKVKYCGRRCQMRYYMRNYKSRTWKRGICSFCDQEKPDLYAGKRGAAICLGCAKAIVKIR